MKSKLEKKLIEIGYDALFQIHSEEMENEVWKFGANKENIEQLAYSKKTSNLGRFFAAEILRHYDITLKKEHYDILSEAYTYALKESNINSDNYIGINANSWGLLYEHDDTGYLGEQLLSFENAAIPHLLKLLNNNGSVVYEGSQEAMLGNSYKYRIKDFAAFYISKIKNVPIKFYQDVENRDREIERFKTSLNAD
jgi:hypothetical protein